MDIQYYHHRPFRNKLQGCTLAFEVPSVELFLKAATALLEGKKATFSCSLGVARLHPKDAYVKSIGRDVAKAGMKQETFEVVKVVIEPDGYARMTLKESNSPNRELKLTYKKGNQRVYFRGFNRLGLFDIWD